MVVQDIYHGLEDHYYAGLDWLDRHGIPVYSVVDAIEAQNIPSFPIAVLALLLVIGGVWAFVFPGLLGSHATLNVLVQDETQTPLKGIAVQLSGAGLSGDALSKRLTDDAGRVTFTNLPIGTSVTVSANHEDYAIDDKSIVLDQGENEKRLIAVAVAVTKSISLQLYKVNSTETFSDAIQLSFACSDDTSFSKTSTVAGGQITIDVPPSCGSLSVASLDSTKTLQNSIIDVDDANPRVYVNAQPSGDGVLRATLLNESGNGIAGLTTMLKSKFGDVLATKFSDASGFVEFTGLAADTYTVFVASDGTYGELDSGSIEVSGSQPTEKTFTVPLASVGEVRVQLVDEGNLSPVNGAKVTLSRGNQVVSTKTTNEGGQVTFSVSSSNSLTIAVDHPTYLVRSGVAVNVSTAGYTQIPMTKATLQNSQIVTVKVVDELNQPVENAYVALKKSPSGASIGTNKVTGASGTVQFTSLEEGTYFATAYKPGFSDQIKSDLFTVKARENVENTIKLVIGNGTISFIVKESGGAPLAGATIQAVDGVTHDNVGNEVATGVDGSAELTLRADRYVYFIVDEPNHLPFITLPTQVKKGITQSVSADLVKDISKLEVKTLGTFVNGKPILEDSGLAPGQTYTVRFALLVPRNTNYTETGVHIRTGNSTDGQTNPIENDGWFIHDVRGAYAKLQKGTTYTSPTGLGIDSQHVTSADAKWANIVFTPTHEGLTIIEADLTVKDSTVQGADLPLYYRAWARTGSYVRFPVDAVLGGSESVAQKQGLYANANVKLYSTGASTHVCSTDFCLGLVGEDLTNGLQTSLLEDFEADISSKQKILFTFTSISDNVFADTSLILQSTTGSATLSTYDVTNAVGAKKTGVVSGNKVEIPIGTIQKNNVVFGFVNMDAAKEGTARVKFSLVSNKKEVYVRELLVKVSAAGVLNVEVVPKAILPLLTNQMLIHVTQSVGGDDIPLENASVNIALNGTLLTSGFTDSEGVFPFELNEPNVNDDVEITTSKQGYKPVTLNVRVGADIVAFIPAQVNESLIVNGTTRKTRDIHMLNLASIPLTIKDVSLSGDFDGLVKFDLLNEEIVGDTLGVNQDRNVTIALSLTEKGQNLLAAKTLKGSVLVKLASDESGKTFTNALPLTLKIGFGGEVDVEDCLLVDPVQWDVYADPKETKQQAFEIRNTCTVKSVPVKLTNLSAKIKQLSGDSLGTFTVVTSDKTTELGSAFKTILNSIPAGGEIVVTASFSPDQIESGLAMPQLIFQATNLTDNGVPDTVEETVKVNLVVNALAKCVQVKTPSVLEIDSCAINTGMGNMSSYYNQVYRPTGVPYFNPSFSTLNNTTNPSGSSLLPSNQSGLYGSYNFGNGPFSPQYGPSGYDGYGGYGGFQNGAQFSPLNGGYNNLQGMYANPLVDRYNYNQGAGFGFGCGSSEIRIENSCQSDIEIQLDADPNVQVSKTTVTLKPNQTDRIRVGSGYRIGKYPVFVNARAAGSKEASLEVSTIDVLIKSPSEVNADCITLNTTKFRFQELIQKPVKGKVINKCYNTGVRLLPNSDTITLASYFTVNDDVSLTDKNSVKSRPNTMAHDIQLIGVQTRGDGRDTVQELEFQIFPDFETYKRVLSPFTENAGLGKQILDLKFFLEGQYYRAESYGTISVKYLDSYGGAQQKPFPVIFENLFRIAGVLDIGDGDPNLTDYQKCINPNVLKFRVKGGASGGDVPLEFTDEDFPVDSSVTQYTTSKPNEVLIVDDDHCGNKDSINGLRTVEIKGPNGSNVSATFKIVDKRNIQVTVNRPQTMTQDVTLKGTLQFNVTRTAFNASTKPVGLDVEIIVRKPGADRALSNASFAPLTCETMKDEGYLKGPGFSSVYGFDKLNWHWEYNLSPNCETQYCDATQLLIHVSKKVKEFNQFIRNNNGTGLFEAGKTYTTQNFLREINESVNGIANNVNPLGLTVSSPPAQSYFLAKNGGLLVVPKTWPGKATIDSILGSKLLKDNVQYKDTDVDPNVHQQAIDNYIETFGRRMTQLEELRSKSPEIAKTFDNMLFVFDKKALEEKKTNDDGTQTPLYTDLVVKLMGGDTVVLNGEDKIVMTYNEFKNLHSKFDPASATASLGFVIGSTIVPTAAAPASVFSSPGTEFTKITLENMRVLFKSMEAVVPAMAVPTDAELAAYQPETVNYILDNARNKQAIEFSPYNNLSDLRARFVETRVMLLPDGYSQKLLDAIEGTTVGTSVYKDEFNANDVSKTVLSTIKAMKFKNKRENNATAIGLLTIPEPGVYSLILDASWKVGDPTGITMRIPTDSTSEYDSVREIDLANEGKATPTKYAENPFFYIPFDGKTANAVGGSNVRFGYGASYSIASGSLALTKNGTLLSGEVKEALTPANLAIHMKKSFSDLADFEADQANDNAPHTLLSVKRTGKDFTINYAPHDPVPVKVSTSNPSGAAVFQYFVGKTGGTDPIADVPDNFIGWNDCTQKNSQLPFSASDATSTASCSPFANQYCLVGTIPGNAYTYTGIASVPADEKTLSMFGTLGVSSVTFASKKGSETLSTSGSTQAKSIPLSNIGSTNLPQNMLDILKAVYRDETACAKIENDNLTVIWDLGKVVPKNLVCSVTEAAAAGTTPAK